MDIRSPEKKIINLKHPDVKIHEAELAEPRPFRHEIFIEWEALEYEHIPKEKSWFIAGGIIASLLMIFALFTANYFFALFVLLASFVVYMYSIRPPKQISAAVGREGVRVGRRIYDFEDLRSFWIFYEAGGIKELSLESKKSVMPYIRVPLGEVEPVKVREALIQFVPEVQHEESLAEIIARILGF